MNIYKYLVIQKSLPREVDSPWRQAPVTLEDSLGLLVPIPLELVTSWKVWLKYVTYVQMSSKTLTELRPDVSHGAHVSL
jgi:hypothetical protein